MPEIVAPDRTDFAALERELLAEADAYNASELPDDECSPWFDRLCALEDRIAEAPAATLADVAVKLRLLRRLECEDGGEFAMEASDTALNTAIDAIEELARA